MIDLIYLEKYSILYTEIVAFIAANIATIDVKPMITEIFGFPLYKISIE
jgi:hypothetical protein